MDATALKINEIFYSIQGESSLVGKPTVFVRTATCNLRCTYCDSRYTFWHGGVMAIDAVLEKVASFGAKYVCVTGGEPLGQKATLTLLRRLVDAGYTVSLETNGSFSVADVPAEVIKVIDVKTPDSGEVEANLWENLPLVTPHDELKFVLGSRADFDWALETLRMRRLDERCSVLFSPIHGKLAPSELAAWILDSRAPVTMQVQMHKTIWSPDRRGV